MVEQLTFGTDGLRGPADQFPLTNSALIRLGLALGTWAHETYQSPISILIGRDTRESGTRIFDALTHGLATKNITVIDAGIIPTPAVLALMRQENNIQLGIEISASHNPACDNGLKFFETTKGKLSPQDEARICKLFSTSKIDDLSAVDTAHKIARAGINTNYAQKYVELITRKFPGNLLAGKTIVLDCGHGATYLVAPEIFTQLGATVHTIGVNPDGTNINKACGALHLELLQKQVVEHGADAGFAFDGDGDRVMAVTSCGEIKDGDDILALLAAHPAYANENTVVATIMSNHGLALSLKAHTKNLARTAVGDKHVAAYMTKHGNLVGGEISGHIILGDYLPSGDGIFAALRTLESIIASDNWSMSSFEKYPQATHNIAITEKKALTQEPFTSIIKAHENKLKNGRIIARYSGTENVLRLMAEDSTFEHAQSIITSLASQLSQELG